MAQWDVVFEDADGNTRTVTKKSDIRGVLINGKRPVRVIISPLVPEEVVQWVLAALDKDGEVVYA